MIEQTRFYLDKAELGLSKLCWFHENKEYEMMFGFYGLSSKEAHYSSQYEDRYVTKEEMLNLRINYKDARIKQNKELTTHFIMHVSGEFHLKLKSGEERYIDRVQLLTPLSDKIGKFLDFFIISDLVSKYEQTIEKPKIPNITIPVSPNYFVCLRGRFSGINFDLEQTVTEEETLLVKENKIVFPAILLNGIVFKGIFTCEKYDSKGINFSNRPDGTYVLIAFPTEEDKYLIKTFVFN